MFDDNDEVKLIDFGFAVMIDQKKKILEVTGTPYYMAPEVISSDDKEDGGYGS